MQATIMHTPTITVIALCYNHEHFVLDCLKVIPFDVRSDACVLGREMLGIAL